MYLRDALRFLQKSPAFTITAVLMLAVGIGANAAIFSFVNALLLRPMPFPDPDRLVRIESIQGGVPGRLMPREWEELDRDSGTFEGVAAWYPSQYTLLSDSGPEVVRACMTTANLFRVLGAPLSVGSSWEEGAHRQRNPVVVLSHELWKKRFGMQQSVIRRSITLDAVPYLVVGVASPGFQFPVRNDIYRAAHLGGAQNTDVRSLFIVGRLRRDVSIAHAQEKLNAFATAQAAQYPNTNRDIGFRVTPLRDAYVGEVRPYVALTLGLSLVVLAIACSNVVNLLLARGVSRRREFAIRSALGAGRKQILGQLLTESLFLNVTGGILGLGIAALAVSSLRILLRTELPSWMDVAVDSSVLLFTLLISVGCGLVAGLYPAVTSLGADDQQALREGSKGSGGSRLQGRVRQALISGEIALAVVLVIASGLLVKSFSRLQNVDTGFGRAQLITFRTDPPWSRYNKPEQTSVFYRAALERLEAIPGVTDAAANHSFPLALNQNYGKPTIVADGQSADEQRRNPFVNVQIVSPNYFRTMGIPLLSGRSLTVDDRLDTQRVAVLSRPLAERLFGTTPAVGRRVRMPELLSSLDDKGQEWFTVVGVAEGVRSESLTSGPGMDLYVSNQQQFVGDTFFILRTAGSPATIGQLAQQAIRQIDPDQPIFGLQTVNDLVEETVWQRRIAGHLSLCFGAIALLLAAVGTYSLLSWIVGQRTREIAVRQALGCTPAAIRSLIVGEGLRLAGAGMLTGLLIAIPLAYAFSGLLFGVSPSDPSVIVGAAAFTLALAVFASAIPAARAARVNANAALKAD